MKRSLAISLGLLAMLVPAAATGRDVSATRAELRHAICQSALEPAARAISVQAVMRPLSGTVRLQLRFELLARHGGTSSYRAISGGDLGSWISPQNPTLGARPGDVWIFEKQVVDLAAPAAYRFRVSFRWVGAHRRVIATTTELARKCTQPELRPDLRVRRVTVTPADKPARSIYLVTVANAGATAAGPFSVQFAPGGSDPLLTSPVTGLAPQATVMLRFNARACVSGVGPTVTVDPGQQVDDFDRSNNVFAITCPAP